MTTTLSVGLSLKPEYYEQAHNCSADGLWFEVHPENYMVAGGPRLAWLEAIREQHPISLHGVALSLAADAEPDAVHLDRLTKLVKRFDPVLVSEHLAWSSWRGAYYPDLLPFPRTAHSLTRIAAGIGRAQDVLQRPIAIENPSHYVRFEGHEFGEIEFLTELARRTGCSLLLDVNNVFVSANNMGFDAPSYLAAFPAALVSEIHLAGHSADPALGAALLVDSHDAPVDAAVWELYEGLIARIGPRPTLIERDGNLPVFDELLTERARAHSTLAAPPALLAA